MYDLFLVMFFLFYSKGAPSYSGHFAPKLPQLAPAAPSFSTLSNQTPPSYSNLLASLNSPGVEIHICWNSFSKHTALDALGHCAP